MRKAVIITTLLLLGVFIGPTPSSAETPKEWTFLVYMDGDNTLSYYTTADINEMRVAGSDSNINIVVLVDYIGASANIHYIKQSPLQDEISSPTVAGIPSEPNMADASNLVKFVNYGVANYPAKKYAVVLWNHGAGWIGFNVDDTSEDITTLPGLRNAMSTIYSSMGRRIDLLGFDECLMQEMTVAYSMKSYVDVMVASQANEVANGWFYAGPLTQLSVTPSMNASVLGSHIVDYYDATAGSSERTLSVVNTTHLERLSHELGSLSRELSHKGNAYHDELYSSIIYTERYYAMADVVGYDLYDWTVKLDDYIGLSAIKARTIRIRSELNQTVYYEKHGPGVPQTHGLSIYLSTRMSTFNPQYTGVYMAGETEHDDFIWDYVRYVDGYMSTPGQPTMQKSGTTLYINNSGNIPSGYGSMFKFIRGGWIEASLTEYSSNQSGVFFARTYNGVDYSDVNEASFTGIRNVVLEAGSGGHRMIFAEGWNLISVPTSVSTQASKFVDEVESGIQVVQRTTAGKYRGYVGGDEPLGDDFTMAQTVGYYFYVDSASSHLISGVPGSDRYTLSEGWNLVGYSGVTISAGGFCAKFDGDNTIVYRSPRGYIAYDEKLNYGDLYITKGMGFYLWSTKTEVVTI